MDIAIKEAIKAYKKDEVPVGCCIVYKNKVLSVGHNIRQGKYDIMGHAEIVAIKKAAKRIKSWNLSGCTMYVTLSPCDLCFLAIKNSRIAKIYISCEKIYKNDTIVIESIFGIMKDTSTQLLKNFFINKRNK
jgi:tRNA(adenine34) deaminase